MDLDEQGLSQHDWREHSEYKMADKDDNNKFCLKCKRMYGEDDLKCVKCTNCGKKFHNKCWQTDGPTCPYCKKMVGATECRGVPKKVCDEGSGCSVMGGRRRRSKKLRKSVKRRK
jgi:hypothetical protein